MYQEAADADNDNDGWWWMMMLMMTMILNDDEWWWWRWDYDNNDIGNDKDDNYDGDVSPDRIKSLLKLLKKHNVYFGKFIIPRKWKEHNMFNVWLLELEMGSWDDGQS